MVRVLGFDNVFLQVGELAKARTFYGLIGLKEKLAIPKIIVQEADHLSPSKIWLEVEDAKKARERLLEKGLDGHLFETQTGFTLENQDP